MVISSQASRFPSHSKLFISECYIVRRLLLLVLSCLYTGEPRPEVFFVSIDETLPDTHRRARTCVHVHTSPILGRTAPTVHTNPFAFHSYRSYEKVPQFLIPTLSFVPTIDLPLRPNSLLTKVYPCKVTKTPDVPSSSGVPFFSTYSSTVSPNDLSVFFLRLSTLDPPNRLSSPQKLIIPLSLVPHRLPTVHRFSRLSTVPR